MISKNNPLPCQGRTGQSLTDSSNENKALASFQVGSNGKGPDETGSIGKRQKGKRGDGHIYIRGDIYWVKYYWDGKQKFESSGSNDRSVAERLVALRVNGFSGPVEGQATTVARRQAQQLARLPKMAPGTLGAISELIVSTDLFTRGFEVFRSMSPCASCDLLAQRGDQVLRVEVKTARLIGERPAKPVIKKGNVFDILATVIKGRQIVYSPAIDEIAPSLARLNFPAEVTR